MPRNYAFEKQLQTNVHIVRRLVAAQFPQWAELPIEPVVSSGTDNAIYRLGEDMSVRVPRVLWSIRNVEKECRWLPRLAPHLALAIPVPLAMGAPGEGYPCHWAVYSWLEGDNVSVDSLADQRQTAIDLAEFVGSLQQIDPTGGPTGRDCLRGIPNCLADMYDGHARDRIASMPNGADARALKETWEAALQAPQWDGPPRWIHSDLHGNNLLAKEGRLTAVIDFGGIGIGDPAVDLMVVWLLLNEEGRTLFRETLRIDDGTWARGRAWGLVMGATDQVLADHQRTGK